MDQPNVSQWISTHGWEEDTAPGSPVMDQADLSKGLSGLAQENYNKIVRDMEDMITEVRGALPQGGTVDSAGNALMKDVIDPNASSPMFELMGFAHK